MTVCVAGHQKQVGPDLFRVFYTIWKETEAEAQEVCSFNSGVFNLTVHLLMNDHNKF